MITSERIRAVLADAPVVDGHNDLLWEMRVRNGYDFDALDLSADQTATGLHTDLPRLRAGGVGAQFWSMWAPCRSSSPVITTFEQIDAAYRMAERYASQLRIVTAADQLEQAIGDGKIASLLGVEGGHCIGESLGTLRMMHALGVRYLTLTHVANTPWADSATDEPRVGGLNEFGRDVVREMNRLGMLVDLSHVAPTTMHAALDVSVAPAFFSHSSARAVCDHPRNVPDDVLARVKDTDGLVMVTFVPGFLNEKCSAWMGSLGEEEDRLDSLHPHNSPEWTKGLRDWLSSHPRPSCTVADVADHVEHVRDVAGVDHVGIGGDFDGCVCPPDGLTDVAGYPALLAELAERSWSDAELGALTLRNALRVLRATEAAASAGA